jgi:hypothetical protein
MTNKLTLKLDKNIIEQAKLYAKLKDTSLSELVENYFAVLTSGIQTENTDYAPLTQELLGVIAGNENMSIL